jgi:hypothetical protein
MCRPPGKDSNLKPPGTRVVTPQGKHGVVLPHDADYLRRQGSDAVFVQIISPQGEVPVELYSSANLTVIKTSDNGS